MRIYELRDLDAQFDLDAEPVEDMKLILQLFTPNGPQWYGCDTLEENGDSYAAIRATPTADDPDAGQIVVIFSAALPYTITPRRLFRLLNEADLFERGQEEMQRRHAFEQWHNTTYPSPSDPSM